MPKIDYKKKYENLINNAKRINIVTYISNDDEMYSGMNSLDAIQQCKILMMEKLREELMKNLNPKISIGNDSDDKVARLNMDFIIVDMGDSNA